jgi:hypothetical protein
MTMIHIILEGDGAFKDLQGKEDKVIHLADQPFTVAALDRGTFGGRPSVMIRLDLPDGRVVLQQTTARLWITVARALRGKWPDELGEL